MKETREIKFNADGGQYVGFKDTNDIEIYEGDVIGMFLCGDLYKKGIVTFGAFDAEIYTCYGWYVSDTDNKQVSEAGLTEEWTVL